MASRKRRRDGDALDALAAAADAIGFDARAFERDGFAFLDNYALGEGARARALASALASRLWARRADLSVVTRRVAAESARQTADRLRIK